MKKLLLTSLLSMTVAGMVAATPVQGLETVRSMTGNVTVKTVKNQKQPLRKALAPGVTLTAKDGLKKLDAPVLSDKAKPTVRKNAPRRAASALPEGYVLFESFEGWDGVDPDWTPDGWTVDMRGDVTREESWTISSANAFLPGPADGDLYYGISYSMGNQDEWLISPQVEIAPDMVLSYWLYASPAFLFSMENVDFDTMEYIGDKVVAATLQIWVQPEGGEWTMIHDIADDYKDLSLMDLYMLEPSGLEKRSEDLTAYAGQKVNVAFRYVGTDGNTMFLDAIGVGYPALEDISYMDPFSTLYWGFERSTSLSGLGAAIAQYPVYAPLTWTNMSYIDGATFSWEYCDPITAEFVTFDDPDELTVTYVPDYRSPESMKNNLFYPPVLNATAPGSTPGSYTAPYAYFQAGGKGERTLNNGSELNVSLMQFSFLDRGLAMVMVDDETIGDNAIPVFGHNVNTDQYWLNYSLNGEQAQDGDYSRLEGIANVFFPTSAPLVVNGLTVFGYGRIDADAEFTATIYALNEECSTDISTFTNLGSVKIKGSDVLSDDPMSRDYLVLPFDFAEPVVVQATDEHPAYVFMFEGFNSDKVEFFAPIQSSTPDPNYMCAGYILNHIDLSGHIDRAPYYSFKPMVYKADGDYVDPYGAFAIAIEGEYPWLTTGCEAIEISPSGEHTTVPLGSYFDGSRLSVEVPAGAEAKIEGRYNECLLTVWHNDADVIVKGNAVIKGPGVELSIPVEQGTSALTVIKHDSDTAVEDIYDLNGNRLTSPVNGINIVKYSDGTVRKQAILTVK